MKKLSFLFSILFIGVSVAYSQKREVQAPQTDKSGGYNKKLENRPGYVLVPALSDEFNGTALDTGKWVNHMTYWKGRGAEFLPSNVSVKDGYLQLKSSIKSEAELQNLYSLIDSIITGSKKTIDINTWSPAMYGLSWESSKVNARIRDLMNIGLKAIGAASVMSKDRIADSGYYETRIKASKLSMSSSFWLQGGPQGASTEMDITESWGNVNVRKTPNDTIVPYKITTSIWNNNAPRGAPQLGTTQYILSKTTSAEFFVLGFQWGTKEVVVYYNDKEIMRRRLDANPEIPYARFGTSKYLIYDCEVLNGPWVGWPTKSMLIDPASNVFYVDWIRVWKRSQ